MRRKVPMWSLFIVLAAGWAGPALAQIGEQDSGGFTFGAESDLNSRYVWRSLAWSRGAVWQPSVWIGRSGFVFSVWTNFPLADEPTKHKFNEVDFRFSYSKEWGRFALESAFNVYSYPNQDKEENPTTGELEITAAYAFAPFILSTTHFLDLWDNAGGYIGEVALEFEDSPSEGMTVNAAARLTVANAKFQAYYVPIDKAALDAVVFELGLRYDLGERVYLRPHLEWTSLVDGEVKRAVAASPWVFSGKASLLNFGIAFGVEF